MGLYGHLLTPGLVHLFWKRLIIPIFFLFLSLLLLFQVVLCEATNFDFVLFHRWLFARVFLIPQEPGRPKRVDGENNQSEPAWKPRKKNLCLSVCLLPKACSEPYNWPFHSCSQCVTPCFIPQPRRSTFPLTFSIKSAAQSSFLVNGEVILVLRRAVAVV